MFYAHFVLAKKGPLAKIWLAAHWDKKLTKAHVFETNIEKSVDGILKPKVKMALRTSGHLLLGVVRIYSRKAKYLLQDCNEAFVKIKMAFRPGMVDLPEEHREAAMNAITLPEVFHDFDTAMPELNEVDIEAQFSLNQSRAEEITMREDYGSLNLVTHDDGFGDMGFDTDNPDIMRDAIGNEGGLEQSNLVFGGSSSLSLEKPRSPLADGRLEPAPLDQFNSMSDVEDFGPAGGLFEGDLFGEVSATASASASAPGLPQDQPQSLQAEIAAGVESAEQRAGAASDASPDHYDAPPSPPDPPSPAHSWCESPAPPEAPPTPPPAPAPMEVEPPAADSTTLLHNDEESFALAPVDATVLKGITKSKRKRKLIVDEVKNISGEEMKNQLSNTSDIVTTLDLAPPTRRLMHWKETGGVEKLFTLPARPIPSRVLFKKYQRNMTLRSDDEPETRSPDAPDAPRRTRKRRHDDSAAEPAPGPAEAPPTPAPAPDYEPALEETPSSPARDEEPPTPAPAPPTPAMLSDHGGLTPSLHGAGALPLLEGGLTPAGLAHAHMTPGGLSHGGMTPGALSPGALAGAGLLDAGLASGAASPAAYHGGMTPAGYTPAGMTPAGFTPGGMTPAGFTPGGMTPAGFTPGGMTPAGFTPGGMTPAGFTPSGMTPAGLTHGGMTPAGLTHGGMTPAGLTHGGMTPVGLTHGGMTPAGLTHGGMTPAGLTHGGMTPAGLTHGGMTPTGLHHGGLTPAGLQHGHHPALLHSTDQSPLLGGVQLQPSSLPLSHSYRDNMTNLGYDDHQGQHSPQHDYDLPQSPENDEDGPRELDETEEQFSERVLNRRAAQLLASMRGALLQRAALAFTDLAPHRNTRKQVAQKFYSLLVLKKHQVLKLEQHETYGPIAISKGAQFETEAI